MTISGSGTSYTYNGLAPDTYYFRVSNGSCTSAEVTAGVYAADGMSAHIDAAYVDTNGDGVTDVGDVVNFTLVVTNLYPCPLTNITIVESTMGLQGSVIPSIPANGTDNSLTATYVLTQDDINAGSISFYDFISGDSNAGGVYTKAFGSLPLSLPDGMHLNAFIDSNGNGIQDIGEQDFSYGQYHYTINSGTQHNVYAFYNPVLLYETNPANSYNLSFDVSGLPCGDQYVSATTYSGDYGCCRLRHHKL